MTRRRLFNVAAMVSSVLCVVATLFWVSGIRWSLGSVVRETRPLTEARWAVIFGDGSVLFQVLGPLPHPPPPAMDPAVSMGFGYGRGSVYASGATDVIVGEGAWYLVPFWFVVLATAGLPLYAIVPAVRGRFVTPPGSCPSCRYDLRATPDRCPECGAVPNRAAGAA